MCDNRPTYLDDPDHVWDLDPSTTSWDRGAVEVLDELLDRCDTLTDRDIALIVRGAVGLRKRLGAEATSAECVDTSLVWYFG